VVKKIVTLRKSGEADTAVTVMSGLGLASVTTKLAASSRNKDSTRRWRSDINYVMTVSYGSI